MGLKRSYVCVPVICIGRPGWIGVLVLQLKPREIVTTAQGQAQVLGSYVKRVGDVDAYVVVRRVDDPRARDF